MISRDLLTALVVTGAANSVLGFAVLRALWRHEDVPRWVWVTLSVTFGIFTGVAISASRMAP